MYKQLLVFYQMTIPALCLGSLISLNVDANTLTMNISGHIKDRCEINFSSGNTMTFTEQTTQSLPFDLYCNRPLGITISSKYGGLKHQQDGLDIIENYDLTLQVDALHLNESRKSQQLLTPTIIEDSSGVIPFSQQGVLRVALENTLLFAGYYQDVIEIEVYPSIHNVTR
ncbi:hypothetical protein [Marinomonas ostreistagni]|uniref:hypothetical protein n=1 Tax=Marinomonas ostreistagni TaxID=359209 RepID=UPI001950F987|nr:hypothetical protein [Marinomonas ostreistagni]MBM6549906.1 hypothetical protein [Marinomonas ostreistagni]